MSNFNGKLRGDLLWRDGERIVELREPLHYYSSEFDIMITAPVGFVSDGASVPRFFWRLFPPFGRYLESAVIHDVLCCQGKTGKSQLNYKQAAFVFREAMELQGVGRIKRAFMYRAVLHFGPRF